MITDKDLEAYIGFPITDTSEYDAEDLRKAAKASYIEGKREATREWAWWKDGVQYVGSCGKTLAQALDIIAEEEEKGNDYWHSYFPL
jgi:hypothetical protein